MIRPLRLRPAAPPPAGDAAQQYGRAAFVMFCGAAIAAAYALLPGTRSALHTWIASLLALALVWGSLLHGERGRIPLRVDVIVLVGFSVSFLLPPLYLSLRGSTPFTDPWRVAARQPQVALLAGMAAFVFRAAFVAVYRRLSAAFPPAGAPKPLAMSRALPGLAAIAGVIVLARMYLLVSGAYYWVYSEEGFLFGRWYSVTNNLSRLGLIVPILLWLLAAHDRRWRAWAWAATAAELAWVIPSGSRQALLETVFGFLLVAWWRNAKLPRGRILAALLAATFTMPILGEYRYTIARYSGTREVSFDATVRALWDARDRLGFSNGMLMTDRFTQRLYDGQYFGYLLQHYREAYDWEYGATYSERLPYVMLPYFVNPNRPIMQVPLDRWFKLQRGGSNPATLIGEGYANFGYFGIPLVALVLAVVLAGYETVFRRLRENVFIDAVYLLHASMMPMMVSTSLAHWLSFLRNALVMMVATLVLMRVLRSLGVRSSRVPPPLTPRPYP